MDEQQPETPETPDAEVAPEAPAVPTPELPEVETPPAEEVVADAPSVEEIVEQAQPAEEVVAQQPAAEEIVAEQPPAEDVVAAADAPPAPQQDAEAPADQPAPGGKRKRPRRRKGSKVAEQWGVSKSKAQEIATKVEAPKPRRERRPPSRGGGRSREPLPFDELRTAAQCITDLEGARKALRDAFGELAPKERNDISRLVSEDGDFRQRARSISAGSLAARKIGKALAAQQVAIASIEDMWAVTLSKEEAAERLSRVRRAKNRDRERAKRNEERANRADRVSKEDLAKAQDGRVGAQIRFVVEGETEKRDRKGKKKKKEPATANDLLDRLGY